MQHRIPDGHGVGASGQTADSSPSPSGGSRLSTGPTVLAAAGASPINAAAGAGGSTSLLDAAVSAGGWEKPRAGQSAGVDASGTSDWRRGRGGAAPRVGTGCCRSGSSGRCAQGHAYRGTGGEICGGNDNGGSTDGEGWYPHGGH